MADPLVFDVIVGTDVIGVDVATQPVVAVEVADDVVAVVTVEGPPGPHGLPGTGLPIVGEPLTGIKDGVNTVFTTAHNFRAQSTAVYLNGLREFEYAETGPDEITFDDPPLAGDTIRIDYVI